MSAEPAPLISIAEAPAPPGGGAEWLHARDGARLRAALFRPPGEPRGTVIVNPGRTEPIEKYFEVVGELQARGFAVLVHDWRGHGLSARMTADPMKGHADGWRTFADDFRVLLDRFEDRAPEPWILLGHSMGGALGLLALVEGETRIDAALLTAPMLGLQLRPFSPAVARRVVGAMRRIGQDQRVAPGQPPNLVELPFEQNLLTHDRPRWDRTIAQLRACPELQLGGVTWGWLGFALELQGRIAQAAPRIGVPATIVAAGEDRLCTNTASRAVAAQAPGVRYVEVAGAYHELLMETDEIRAQVWAEFDTLAERVAPSGRVGQSSEAPA